MKLDQKISCIVSAYNEAENINRVLTILNKINWLDEIIVVDDGSQDRTLVIAQSFKIPRLKIVHLAKNQGKGAAMAAGVKVAKYNLLLFLDADLVGLKEIHLKKILAPIVFTQEADLVLGVFALKYLKKHSSTKFANRMFPAITGQRAIWRKNLPPLARLKVSRYSADLLITKNVLKRRRAVVKLEGLSQIRKEEKAVIGEAIKARIKMYREVMKLTSANSY